MWQRRVKRYESIDHGVLLFTQTERNKRHNDQKAHRTANQ